MKPNNPIEKLLPTIAEGMQEWLTKNPTAVIKETVKKHLDSKVEDTIFRLLGFKTSWGHFEVDHCNGRAGESAAGDYLREAQKEAINEWLATVQLPKLSSKAENALRREAKEIYEDALFDKIRQLAFDAAKRDADILMKDITVVNHVDNYIKLMKLVNPV